MLSRKLSVLKLDVDAGMPRPSLARLCGLCRRAGYTVEAVGERRSPGGRGWHLTITVSPRPRSLVEIVALQAILGSDPWREAVTLYRARTAWDVESREMANVLYARKGARGRLFGKGAILRMDIVEKGRSE